MRSLDSSKVQLRHGFGELGEGDLGAIVIRAPSSLAILLPLALYKWAST